MEGGGGGGGELHQHHRRHHQPMHQGTKDTQYPHKREGGGGGGGVSTQTIHSQRHTQPSLSASEDFQKAHSDVMNPFKWPFACGKSSFHGSHCQLFPSMAIGYQDSQNPA